MRYDTPIESPKHAKFCRAEAEKRYGGKIFRDDEYGMLLIRDENGLTYTDAVLRALSFYGN